MGIYYLDQNDDQIDCINVDIVYDGSQEAVNVIRCFRFLRQQSFFQEIEKKNYILWSDAGKHFKCAELTYYFLYELAAEKINVNLNFFAEKHGKNSRDEHFSHVALYIKQLNFKKQLSCTKDIVDAINDGQARSNEHRLSRNEKIIRVIALELNDVYETGRKKKVTQCYLTIPLIESFYNFRTVGETFKIVTSYTSNSDKLIEIEGLSDSCVSKKFETKKQGDFIKEPVSIDYIERKQKTLTNLVKRLEKTNNDAYIFLSSFFSGYLGDLDIPELCTKGILYLKIKDFFYN